MRIRQAKKILSAKHWKQYCRELRPKYYNEERKVWIYPSFHDIPNKTYQKARRKYFGAALRFYKKHGYRFDENKKEN